MCCNVETKTKTNTTIKSFLTNQNVQKTVHFLYELSTNSSINN